MRNAVLGLVLLGLAIGFVWKSLGGGDVDPALDTPGVTEPGTEASPHLEGAAPDGPETAPDLGYTLPPTTLTPDTWRDAVAKLVPESHPRAWQDLVAFLQGDPEALREVVEQLLETHDLPDNLIAQTRGARFRALLRRVGDACAPPFVEVGRAGGVNATRAFKELGRPTDFHAARAAVVDVAATAALDPSVDPELRRRALHLLDLEGRVPAGLRDAFRRLLLADADGGQGIEAFMRSAGRDGEVDSQDVEALETLLRDKDSMAHAAILAHAHHLGDASHALIDAMLVRLDHPGSEGVHVAVLEALAAIDADTKPVVEDLITRLEDTYGEAYTRSQVLRTLAGLGPEGRRAATAWGQEQTEATERIVDLMLDPTSGMPLHWEGIALALEAKNVDKVGRAVDALRSRPIPGRAWPKLESMIAALDERAGDGALDWAVVYRGQSAWVAAFHLDPMPAEARQRLLERLARDKTWDIALYVEPTLITDPAVREAFFSLASKPPHERRTQVLQRLKRVADRDLARAVDLGRRAFWEEDPEVCKAGIRLLGDLACERASGIATGVLEREAARIDPDALASDRWAFLRSTLRRVREVGALP